MLFYRKDLRKKQRLAFGSLIDLNRRSRAAAFQFRRRGSPAGREGGEKGLGAHSGLGVVGIVEGKLGGGGSTRDKAGAARFRGWRRRPVTGAQEGEGNWSGSFSVEM
jgi:hypothetical protein